MHQSLSQSAWKDILLIVLLSAICFFPAGSAVPLFDWDEINFAESAREMLVSGNYLDVQINYQPFYEKPPLFFWAQAACMQVFGVNEWAARLPNALAGLGSLLLLWHLGITLRDRLTAWILVLTCLASLLPHLYFRTGIIDPFFNLLILLGLYFFLLYLLRKPRLLYAMGAGLSCGLAVLAKGPVAILFTALVIALFLYSYRPSRMKPFLVYWLMAVGIPLIGWYGTLTAIRGSEFLVYFLQYQIELFTSPVAGHDQPWFYHLLVLALLGFPFSWLMPAALANPPRDYRFRQAGFLFTTLFISVLLIFSISTTKIVHYSSLAWLPCCIVSGLWIRERIQFPGTIRPYFMGLLLTGLFFGILLLVAGILLPGLNEMLPPGGNRFMTAALQGPVFWSGQEWIPGLCLFLGSAIILICLRHPKFQRHRFLNILILQAVVLAAFLHSTAFWIAPRIAEITQGPALRFYQNLVGQKVAVFPEGFKSYAPYFYSRTPYPDRPELQDKNWLAQGNIDRPVWMVVRADRVTSELEQAFPKFRKAFRSGGFVFFLRMP